MKLEIKMPQLGESIAEGKVTAWLKKVGDDVQKDENLLEVMTDKVTVEVPCLEKGKLVEICVAEEEVAQVGDVVAILEVEGELPKEKPVEPVVEEEKVSAEKKASKKKKEDPEEGPEKVEIPPGVRTFAQEVGVDLEKVVGSGEKGRIRRQDVIAYIVKHAKREGIPAVAPEVQLEEGDQLIPLTDVRRAIAEHMALSKQTIPHVMTAHEVDMQRVMEKRAQDPQKPSVTSYLVEATAKALKAVPTVNSIYTDKGIVQRGHVHIGVAVATEEGLLVPVIRDADQKSLHELAAEVKDLAERARTKKLKPDEVRGGTFTVTNPGVFGSHISAPVIPVGQSGILGVGQMVQRPVVREGEVVVRPILILSLSFDHRTLDGDNADLFLEEIRKQLES